MKYKNKTTISIATSTQVSYDVSCISFITSLKIAEGITNTIVMSIWVGDGKSGGSKCRSALNKIVATAITMPRTSRLYIK